MRGILSEEQFAEHLHRYGAIIVCPESLSFRDQIELWGNLDGVVTGFMGSAFHMAAFGAGKRLCTIAPHGWASSNQALLDTVGGSRTVSGHPVHMLSLEPGVSGFSETLRIVDPKRMADLFFPFIEAHWGSVV